MIKNTTLILHLFLFSLFSCNSEKTQKIETIDNDSTAIVDIQPSEVQDDTSFLDFFENFMWYKEFQESRIHFPIQTNGKEVKTSQEWQYLPFYTLNEYIPTLASDTFSIFDTNENLDSINLFIVDFEKGAAEVFVFEKTNKNWYLEKSEKTTFSQIADIAFIDFLIKFSTDSIFQINSISFPIPESLADPENDYDIVTKSVKLETWKFWKLTDDINRLMILSNIQIDHKYRNIFFRGVENGIWVKVTFEKINGNWKLIRLQDHST